MLSELTQSQEWQNLQKRAALRQTANIADDIALPSAFKVAGITFDFSNHLCASGDFEALLALSKRQQVTTLRDAMAAGTAINLTEDRAVRHMDLRAGTDDAVEGELNKMEAMINDIRADGRFKTVVNIGIGGSDLGPRMVVRALGDVHVDQPLQVKFVANVDAADFEHVTRHLRAEETVFVICSKTMTTMETMANVDLARQWLRDHGVKEQEDHFIAVSTNHQAMDALGIRPDRRLGFWDWVGGRYSLWSSIGVSIALAFGMDVFRDLLSGANVMDQHFMCAQPSENMPMIGALLGVWYRNFMGCQGYAIHTYTQALELLVPYMQQLDMESNGKSVSREGRILDYDTGPIIFGQTGSNGQHAFFQWMHQGTQMTPSDFIGLKTPYANADHHRLLRANMQAQVKALVQGQDNHAQPHRHFSGNRPSTVIELEELNASTIGALLAYYEHRTFVQGAIWDINSFDQWGVELGKVMTKDILAQR